MKTLNWLAAAMAALALTLTGANAQTTEAAAAQTAPAVPSTLLPGAAEVVRLATSGVGEDVVLAYIQNAQTPFNLSANDLLYLKDLGVSSQVSSAMINRDGALRGQPPQYAPAPSAPAAAAPAKTIVAAAPAPVYVSSPPPDVTYFYNDLAPYGTWVQLDGYGWCWQPTAVVLTRGWRPYGDGGYWVYSDLGWYWQSTYSWGWAPFHYGRWHQHPRCGWVWFPDRTWGPAWVTWRTYGDTCGWAPLPPHSTFDVRLGWRYNGVAVGASFGFNLGSDAFLFVGFSNFGARNLRPHCLPPARVATVYHQTTIINNYTVVNNRVVNRGVPVERVSAASRGGVPRATVRDWSASPGGTPNRATSVVYRSRPQAPARPVAMEAQRVDNQHPVIRHAPAASARPEQRAALERVGRSSNGKPAVESLQANAAPRTSRPEAPPQIQTASRGSQKPPATPPGRAPSTSNWSREAQPQPAAPARPAVSAPSAAATPQKPATASVGRTPPERASVPASPQRPPSVSAPKPARSAPSAARASQPPDDWKQGTRAAPSYRSDAGLAARFNTRESSPGTSTAPKPHVYYPKGYYQNSEWRSPPPSGRSTSSPPRGK